MSLTDLKTAMDNAGLISKNTIEGIAISYGIGCSIGCEMTCLTCKNACLGP